MPPESTSESAAAPDENHASASAVDLALAVDRLRGRLRQESGLASSPWSRSQLAALKRVVSGPPCTTSDLAASEYMRPQSMAQIVSALEDGGLVTRHQDPRDGRRMLISATERGREVVRSALATREAWLSRAVAEGLDDLDRDALPEVVRILERLADWAVPPVTHRAPASAPSGRPGHSPGPAPH
ncbi:MarR family winged helix-turn-helix transcriptional regulator [Streptomyces sp. AK02-01A]|uniref:MarR family winged helix-turn-helix transcriptional regulator n=1 Tax=Streptomyces sp. AK02-01A TaxID=3028648 RepID=UPI0029BB91F1|nr:MarR family transcriptional regulator [Streptomyces sp. AK02-01A]MDX3850065.1 MarR family transcriptional regulator [Streptomyces sp. AK02-01A]